MENTNLPLGTKFLIKTTTDKLNGLTGLSNLNSLNNLNNIIIASDLNLSQALVLAPPSVKTSTQLSVSNIKPQIVFTTPKTTPSGASLQAPPLITFAAGAGAGAAAAAGVPAGAAVKTTPTILTPVSAPPPATANITKLGQNITLVKSVAGAGKKRPPGALANPISMAQEMALKSALIKEFTQLGVKFTNPMLRVVNVYFAGARKLFAERIAKLQESVIGLQVECAVRQKKIEELEAEKHALHMRLLAKLERNERVDVGVNTEHDLLGLGTSDNTDTDTDVSCDSAQVQSQAQVELLLSRIRSLSTQFLENVESSLHNTLKHSPASLQPSQRKAGREQQQQEEQFTISSLCLKLVDLLDATSDEDRAEYADELNKLFLKVINLTDASQYAVDGESIAQLQLPYDDELSVLDVDVSSAVLKDVNMGIQLDIPQVAPALQCISKEQLGKRGNYIVHDLYQYMQACNTDVNAFGDKPIHRDVLSDCLGEVKKQCLVLKLMSLGVDIVNQESYTALHLAIMHDISTAIICTLLQFKADFRARDADGNTVMHLAVQSDTLPKLMHPDVRKHVDEQCFNRVLNVHNNEGYTPLHLAAIKGNAEQTELLLSFHANVNLCDTKSGRTALYHAIEGSHVDVVNVLRQYDADPYVPTYAGVSIVDAVTELESDFTPEMKKIFYNVRMKGHHHLDEENESAQATPKEKRAKRRARLLAINNKRRKT